MQSLSRRFCLGLLGAAGLVPASLFAGGSGSPAAPPRRAISLDALRAAIRRLLPRHAGQIDVHILPLVTASARDQFRIEQHQGRLRIGGTSGPAIMAGVHWYLKYSANAHISLAGEQVTLPAKLPLPKRAMTVTAQVQHRYQLNDTDDGYSGPYRNWADWEALIDRMALQGTTAMLVTVGQEALYFLMLLEYGYTADELLQWIPGQAHQPWWLLQNMSGFAGPVTQRQLTERTLLGRRIVQRLLELGIEPVLPGYFGTVPKDFAERNVRARTIPQGKWVGFDRPDWLDTTSPIFANMAASFYAHQRRLFGDTRYYKIDLLHEGGKSAGVDVTAAARAVQKALDAHRKDAIWVILGWQKNPTPAILAGADRARMLVVDGLADRYSPAPDREQGWQRTPYAFGSIANFGGHTTLGAKAHMWRERFYAARAKADSALDGIAWMPEGSYRDAAAMELFGELAWRETPISDIAGWFSDYARFRYGGEDPHARAAWRALGESVYQLDITDYTEPPDSLFGARPSLDTKTAAAWSPETIPYDAAKVETALADLLQIAPRLRTSDAYRFDLVDIGRQCLANRARQLLPRIKAAYDSKNAAQLAALTRQWMEAMQLSERLLQTHECFLLGPWLERARAAAKDPAEAKRFEYDARSILTIWGPKAAADGAPLHDYANREWAGLMRGLYIPRWQRFFDSLIASLQTGKPAAAIDWFAMEEGWARQTDRYPVKASGSTYAAAQRVAAIL